MERNSLKRATAFALRISRRSFLYLSGRAGAALRPFILPEKTHAKNERSDELYTAGKNTSRITEYIKNQLKEDELGERLTISSPSPFTGCKE